MRIFKRILIVAILMGCLVSSNAQENERWNSTPNDINNLLKTLKGTIDANYTMEVKTIGEINVDPEANPIIYYSGHYDYSFSPGDREKLRKYMLDGGMMIFNTGLGSLPFYTSTKKELALIFPEVSLQRLSSDHPIFHSYYDVDRVKYSSGVAATGFRGNEPWIDGVTINCRTLAIVSRFGLAVGWDGGEVYSEYAAYMPESAQKVGANIMAYATSTRAWAAQMAGKMKFVDADKHTMDKVSLVQVVYDGEWKTRHAGISVLLQQFNAKTSVPVKFGLREFKLSDPKIFNAPLLYITGHENFRLTREDAVNLKRYILNGGFLFAEACCGRKGFDLSFRQQLAKIFGSEHQLMQIPIQDDIFSLPNEIKKVGVTRALANETGGAITPRLYGMEVDGHYGIIYSPYGLAGGWEMSPSPYAFGYDTAGALMLGQNILMYAITN